MRIFQSLDDKNKGTVQALQPQLSLCSRPDGLHTVRAQDKVCLSSIEIQTLKAEDER